jgi:hypothetical protein
MEHSFYVNTQNEAVELDAPYASFDPRADVKISFEFEALSAIFDKGYGTLTERRKHVERQ